MHIAKTRVAPCGLLPEAKEFFAENNRKIISQFTFPVDFAKEIIVTLIIWIKK